MKISEICVQNNENKNIYDNSCPLMVIPVQKEKLAREQEKRRTENLSNGERRTENLSFFSIVHPLRYNTPKGDAFFVELLIGWKVRGELRDY